jgi:hypothetical protein
VNAFVVLGLVKRRAELAGEIERTHESLRKRDCTAAISLGAFAT